MEDIHIYQIFYSEQTLADNDPGFNSLDNLSNERPDWSEYWPIRNFLLNNQLNESDYYGFFSPKFRIKTNLDSDTVYRFIRDHSNEADVFLFSPFFDQSAFPLNMFEQGAAQHRDIMAAFQGSAALVAPGVDLSTLVMDSRNTVFCNFIVAKPSFWKAWFDKCEQIYAVAEDGGTTLAANLNAGTNHDGKISPNKVFVIERIASLLLCTEQQWRVMAYNPTHLPYSSARVAGYPLELIQLDALKMASATLKYPQYLAEYYQLRRSIVEQIQQAPENSEADTAGDARSANLINWNIRYQKLINSYPEILASNSVLEIGSGQNGFAIYTQYNVVGLEPTPVMSLRNNLSIVTGSVAEIPCPDNSYDYVICSDVMEHLPKELRAVAVKEIMRVCNKKAFIQFPFGSFSRYGENLFAKALTRQKQPVPDWLTEHFNNSLPVLEEVLNWFPCIKGTQIALSINETMMQHFAAITLDQFFPEIQQASNTNFNKIKHGGIAGDKFDLPYSLFIAIDKEPKKETNPSDALLSRLLATELPVKENADNESIGLYVISHVPFSLSSDLSKCNILYTRPIEADGSNQQVIVPSSNEEIENWRYSEISGISHILRTSGDIPILGVNHYRRFFVYDTDIDAEKITIKPGEFSHYAGKTQDYGFIRKQLRSFDMILPRQFNLTRSNFEHYAMSHSADDYLVMLNIITERWPHLYTACTESVASHELHAYNMVVAKRELFSEIFDFVIAVLAIARERIAPHPVDDYQRRDLSFLAERVFDIYIRYLLGKSYKALYLPTLYIDYAV